MKIDTKQNVCLFFSSSDNTKDVFFYTYQAFSKFWDDCPYDVFIGNNSHFSFVNPIINQIHSENLKSWRKELFNQIANLPSKYEYVILFLDDFFLKSKVSSYHVEDIIERAIKANADYTRLKPKLNSFIVTHLKKLFLNNDKFETLNINEPYYSSLQVVLWKKSYLLERLSKSGSIWEFEHEKNTAIHYAIRKNFLFDYIHIVEKGKWNFYTKNLLNKSEIPFHPGYRKSLGFSYAIYYYYKEIVFLITGYTFMKLKNRFNDLFNSYSGL